MDRTIDNKYRLLRQLGAGGMGSVYEAEHTGVGRRVAIKLLHRTIVEADPTNLGRLQREARLAGTLDSPHIAQVSDVGVDPETGTPYLVLEYLEGIDLDQLIRIRGKVPVSLALRIAAQACMGLKRAHEAGVIHRDIKPANLFLSRRDDDVVVKVLDFGIAKPDADELAKLDQAALTRTGTLIGSPLYMSPEQARGLKTLDKRADIWSMGVVLFNMLAGRTPNQDVDALGELILSICSVASPSVRDYAPETPMEVAEIVQRALAILPEHRFANAGEMYDALVGALDTAAKGSARHAIELSELPQVEAAATEGRRVSPREVSASGPVALGRTELPTKPPTDDDEAAASAHTVISSPDLLGPAQATSGARAAPSTAVLPPGSVPADPRGSFTTESNQGHAASVEGVVSSPHTMPPPPKPRGFWWAAALAGAVGVGAAYFAFGTTTSTTPSTGAGRESAAATASASAPEVVPSVTPSPTNAPIEVVPEPTASSAPDVAPTGAPAETATATAVTTAAPPAWAPKHGGSTGAGTAQTTASPADTSTFGGRK